MMLCRVRRQNSPDIGAMDAEAAGDLGIGEPVSFETADLSHLDAHRGFAAFVFTFGLGRRNPFTLIGAEQTNHDLADFDEDANRADDEARDKSPAPSARLP
jgi:hypothetical protein